MLWADDAGFVSQSPDSSVTMMAVNCEGMHGVQPDCVMSQDGDNVPPRKGYASGGIQRPRRSRTQTNEQVCISWGDHQLQHPTYLGRSRDECSERRAHTIGTDASCTIDRPRTSDSRNECSQSKPLKPSFPDARLGAPYRLIMIVAAGSSCTPKPLYRMAETKPHRPCSVHPDTRSLKKSLK